MKTRAVAKRLEARSPIVLRRRVEALHASLQQVELDRNHYRSVYETWVPPGHFYSPYPDLDAYREQAERLLDPDRELAGVDMRDAQQLELLDRLSTLVGEPEFPEHEDPSHRYWFDNPGYSWGDAMTLHAVLRHLRPRRVVEVGSGYSSMMILDTIDGWLGGKVDVTFVEPYAELLRSLMRPDDESRVTVLDQPVQNVDLDVFARLEPGDVLFIDSTHVVKPGSDVNHLVFEVLPRLQPNVWVHIHDMFFPFDYPVPWVLEGRAWQEAYLVRAFLMFNPRFEIRWFQDYMWKRHREVVQGRMPWITRNTGGNLWLEKVE